MRGSASSSSTALELDPVAPCACCRLMYWVIFGFLTVMETFSTPILAWYGQRVQLALQQSGRVGGTRARGHSCGCCLVDRRFPPYYAVKLAFLTFLFMPQVKVGEADDVGCGCSEATTGRPRHWSREGSSSLAVGGHSAVLPSCCPPVLLVPRLLLCYRAPSSCTTPSWARSYGSTSRWRRKRTTNPGCPVVVSCVCVCT